MRCVFVCPFIFWVIYMLKHTRKGVWILGSQRTGTGLLGNYLNNVLDFPIHEYWNPFFFKKKEWVKNNKVFPEFTHSSDLERMATMPVNFILQRRRDKIATTTSRYIANQTKMWAVRDDTKKKLVVNSNRYKRIKVRLSDHWLMKTYKEVCRDDLFWNSFLEDKKYIEIFYEDFIANKYDIAFFVFEYCGLDTSGLKEYIENSPYQKQSDLVKETYLKVSNRLEQLLNG
jgi:hypothetical protein